MKNIDIRIDDAGREMLKGLIGKQIVRIEHDEFAFTNTSSQVVRIVASNQDVYIYNFAEPMDYYGSEEDVAVMTVEGTKYPIVDSKSFIASPVYQVVKQVFLVQENQQVFEDSVQTYDVWVTRGIIFDFGEYQIAFEKASWVSEDIAIWRGYDLVEKFASVENFTKSDFWDSGINAECIRSIEEVTE